MPFRNCCHNGPLFGNSKLHDNSNIVIPKLNISAAFVNCPASNSFAIYRESPSLACWMYPLNN